MGQTKKSEKRVGENTETRETMRIAKRRTEIKRAGIKRERERERYSRVVLLLDEIEFLFDPLASVRHREFQSARSPAATAAALQEKRGEENEGIRLAVYTRQCRERTR